MTVKDRRRLSVGQGTVRRWGLIEQACVDGAPESEWNASAGLLLIRAHG